MKTQTSKPGKCTAEIAKCGSITTIEISDGETTIRENTASTVIDLHKYLLACGLNLTSQKREGPVVTWQYEGTLP